MTTIKVKFEWTMLMKITDTRSSFKKVSTEVEALTFEEIRQIHMRNYKGIGSVCTDHAYLTDRWRDYSVRMDMDSLREKAEAANTVFVVELDYPWLRFAPAEKTANGRSVSGGKPRLCRNLN